MKFSTLLGLRIAVEHPLAGMMKHAQIMLGVQSLVPSFQEELETPA